MLRKLMAVLIVAFAVQPAIAWADGPSGSKETKNQVKCDKGNDVPVLGKVYAGTEGVETCSDDSTAPDGRVMVSFEKQFFAADGDADNPSQAQGFFRLDASGPTCSTPKQTDATEGPGGPCGMSVANGGGQLTALGIQIAHLVG